MNAAEASDGMLSEHTRHEIDRWLAKFPPDQRRSAVLAALRATQHQNHGFLTTELMDAVAAYLGLPPIQVYEVASFYSMFETRPAGRVHVSVCTNISCQWLGAWELLNLWLSAQGPLTILYRVPQRAEYEPLLLRARGALGAEAVRAEPAGVRLLGETHPDVPVYVAGLDRELNQNAYILPGLGDAGDRLFGTL